jgi:hypothetical protein
LTGQTNVLLDGSASSTGALVTYQWAYLGTVPNVSIMNATSDLASFTAPTAADLAATGDTFTNSTLTFELQVSDGVTMVTDMVDVTVGIAYAADIHPYWTTSSCTSCHEPVQNAGNLVLTGTAAATYAQLAPSSLGPRVNLSAPAMSTILTKPGFNVPNDAAHSGGNIFNGTADPYYQTVISWIQQGAVNN